MVSQLSCQFSSADIGLTPCLKKQGQGVSCRLLRFGPRIAALADSGTLACLLLMCAARPLLQDPAFTLHVNAVISPPARVDQVCKAKKTISGLPQQRAVRDLFMALAMVRDLSMAWATA